jgi:hypothetical protein
MIHSVYPHPAVMLVMSGLCLLAVVATALGECFTACDEVHAWRVAAGGMFPCRDVQQGIPICRLDAEGTLFSTEVKLGDCTPRTQAIDIDEFSSCTNMCAATEIPDEASIDEEATTQDWGTTVVRSCVEEPGASP